MKIVNFEDAMREKLNECNEWLTGKDDALVALVDAEAKYNLAKEAVAEYTDENVLAVTEYRNNLKSKLGFVDVPEQEEEQAIIVQ